MTTLTAATAYERYKLAFTAKIAVNGNGCWEWTAQKTRDGYGRFKMPPYQLAHRAAIVLSGQDLPVGAVVDHKCKNRSCVNPDHLRVVTARQNTLENSYGAAAQNAQKTHCMNGHELSGDNVIMRTNRPGRDCRECSRERTRKHDAKRRSKVPA